MSPHQHAHVTHRQLSKPQHCQRDAARRIARIEKNYRSTGERSLHVTGLRSVEEIDVAWHKSKLTHYTSIGKLGESENARGRCMWMLEPVRNLRRRLCAYVKLRPPAGRANFEALHRTDESEIYERAVGERRRAPLHPHLLIGARSGRIDVEPNVHAVSEIDRNHCPARRARCGATEKSISDQRSHPKHAILQSAGLQEVAGSRGSAPEQCRNFV